MSFVRKEDAAKAAKLGVAILAVFGCAAWRVASATAQPAAAPAPVAIEAPVASNPSVAPVADAKSKDGGIEVPALFATTTTDPFRSLTPDPNAAVPTTLPAGPLPTLPLPAGSPVGPLQPIVASAMPVTPAAEAPLRVSGILAGPNATAVVEVGSESIVVRKGRVLPDGSIVVRIDATALTLRRGTKTTVLSIGE